MSDRPAASEEHLELSGTEQQVCERGRLQPVAVGDVQVSQAGEGLPSRATLLPGQQRLESVRPQQAAGQQLEGDQPRAGLKHRVQQLQWIGIRLSTALLVGVLSLPQLQEAANK